MLRAVALAALAAYASAQSLSLSTTCTAALSSIALNANAASCLNPLGLLAIVTSNSSASVIPAVDNWLTGICGAAPCSNQTISAVVANITAGCPTELGGTSGDASSITTLVEQYYPTAREVICLKDGNTNCITESLQDLQTVAGTLTLSNILSIFTTPPTNIPQNITCTNCSKAAYNIVVQNFPQATSDAAAVQQQCGASFTDGTTPAGITESASTAGTATNDANHSGAVSSFGRLGISVAGLVIVSTAFTLLA